MIDGEDLMDYDELMNKSKEGIEKPLIAALYPKLGPSEQKEIEAQHLIDYYDMLPVTLPDFAFPDAKIAIYCDGYEHHWKNEVHSRRTGISRGNYSCRAGASYASGGWEILNETDAVVRTIEQAIRRKAREREDQEKRLRMRALRQTLPIGGAFAAGLVAAVVLMILVESLFPTLFYHLTSGL